MSIKFYYIIIINDLISLDSIIYNKEDIWSTWLAQLMEHVTLDLGVHEFEPHIRNGEACYQW